jgi:hypothetical protein
MRTWITWIIQECGEIEKANTHLIENSYFIGKIE